MIIWEVTRACDLACLHCRAEAMPDALPGTLSFEEGKRLLEEVATFQNPRPILVFTGGDPFKREDLFELIEYGKSLDLVMAVSPSATPLLDSENLRRTRESGAKVISLSLDGSTAEIHDAFRQVDGSFDRTLLGWDLARKAGLKVQVNTTVTRYNLLDLPKILAQILKRQVMTWSVFFLVPVGRGQEKDEISPDEYEAVMNFLYDASKYVSVKTTEGHHYKRVALQRTILEDRSEDPLTALSLHPLYEKLGAELKKIVEEADLTPRQKMRRTPMHINAGNGFGYINYEGSVYPRGFLPSSGGNLREKTLREIYTSSELFQSLRDPGRLQGRCGECEFNTACGGSRSRAFAVTGDYFAEEPFCTYEPGSFEHQKELQNLLNPAGKSSRPGASMDATMDKAQQGAKRETAPPVQ
jgi:radical SAM protein